MAQTKRGSDTSEKARKGHQRPTVGSREVSWYLFRGVLGRF